jgi:hypothetical protein
MWTELRARVRRVRAMLASLAARKGDVGAPRRSMPRDRFWSELREGQRAADAHAAASRP